jgi:DnaJ family protein C protein 17
MDTKPSTATKRPTPPPETGPINAAAASTNTDAPPVIKPLFPGAANASSGSLFPGGAGRTSLFPGGGGGGLFPGGVGAGVGGVGAGVGGGGRVGGGGGNYESVVLDKMRRAQERARIIAQMEAEDAEEAGS